jgi:hypothetical protein
MDQLELLKKDWKKQEADLPKLSYDELSKLIHKKSSSIVKWIFIISVIEFVLPHLLYLFFDHNQVDSQIQELKLSSTIAIINPIFYVIAFVFVILFYRNYRSISANSNPKVLMQNIIKTRNTVKYYIWFVLLMVPVIGGILFYQAFNSPEFMANIPKDTSMVLVWSISICLLLLLIGVLWLFYRLIYGILLNKLKANYNELISNGNGKL